MLTSTFCLVILLVNFALGDPELLGSRVITQPIGKSSPPMYFLYNVGAQIIYDSGILCSWRNSNLAISNADNCSWETNYSEGCKIFRGHFHRLRNIEFSSIALETGNELLAVSVDWTREGVSSECRECADFLVKCIRKEAFIGFAIHLL
ncbi:hypothetical protein ECG_06215 [Echinococcus granulosus]|nr:hypothetical protein ECG_06215 [Echinococcus granulosus]